MDDSLMMGLLTSFIAQTAASPEQIHLALTETPGTMRVTWATMVPHDCAGQVEYGAPVRVAVANNYSYVSDNFTGTLHTAVMRGLASGESLNYTVVSCSGERATTYSFAYQRDLSAGTLHFLAYGDMGVKNSGGTVSMTNLEAATGRYDLFINVGDTSYADDDGPSGNNAAIFDAHFRNIEGHAARMPFMSVPGNHEGQYDFKPYVARMRNPVMANASAELAPFYYSYDYGAAHFVAYSSEHPLGAGSEQFAFLAHDLAAAATPTARAARPWIIMYTHHPMYCSDLATWGSRCVTEANAFRADLAALMETHGVDIHMSGHNHQCVFAPRFSSNVFRLAHVLTNALRAAHAHSPGTSALTPRRGASPLSSPRLLRAISRRRRTITPTRFSS